MKLLQSIRNLFTLIKESNDQSFGNLWHHMNITSSMWFNGDLGVLRILTENLRTRNAVEDKAAKAVTISWQYTFLKVHFSTCQGTHSAN